MEVGVRALHWVGLLVSLRAGAWLQNEHLQRDCAIVSYVRLHPERKWAIKHTPADLEGS